MQRQHLARIPSTLQRISILIHRKKSGWRLSEPRAVTEPRHPTNGKQSFASALPWLLALRALMQENYNLVWGKTHTICCYWPRTYTVYCDAILLPKFSCPYLGYAFKSRFRGCINSLLWHTHPGRDGRYQNDATSLSNMRQSQFGQEYGRYPGVSFRLSFTTLRLLTPPFKFTSV